MPYFYRDSRQYTGDLSISVKCEENHGFLFDFWDFPIEIDSYLNLTEINEEINKKNNIDIFLKINKNYIFFLYKLVQIYNNIKDKIKEKNFGDTKQNLAFSLFENLLSNFIYNNNDESNTFENLLIYNFNSRFINSKYFELYNKIQELPNGKKFYLKSKIHIPIDTNFDFDHDIESLNFYKLCDNIFCLKDTTYHTVVINGYLENLQFNNNNKNNENNEAKVYHLYDEKIIFNGKVTINSFICDIKNMFDNKNIIDIGGGLIIGFYSNLVLINLNLDLLSYNIFDFNFKDSIDKIISLRNNPIKKYLKNKENSQFLLIGTNNIYLFEYIKEKKGIELIKNYNYSKKYFFKPLDYLLDKNTLIFYREEYNNIFFFNLNSFQLETIININQIDNFSKIIKLEKRNKNEIDCIIEIKYKNIGFLLNKKNKKIKIGEMTEEKMIYDENYYPDNYFMSLGNNHYFLKKENNQEYFNTFNVSSYRCDIRKTSIININEKVFAVFAFDSKLGKKETIKACIDIYRFI